MARAITTDSIESKNRVFAGYDVYDFFFIIIYMILAVALKAYVHPTFAIPYLIFSGLIALFLTTGSSLNKKRKNYESIYFFLTKDISVYRPFVRKEKEDV